VKRASVWDFWLYLPLQSIVTSWNGGVLLEFHTSTKSGHNIALDNTGRGPGGAPSFRFSDASNGLYPIEFGPAVTFDAWHHFHIDVHWSYNSDGFYTCILDGNTIINATGPTASVAEGVPWLQFGLYADIGSMNGVPSVGNSQVTIAGITSTAP
jgi:hypothetical protein